MKKAVNLRGYVTPGTRTRRAKREGNALLDAMRMVGMTDAEIKDVLLKIQKSSEGGTSAEQITLDVPAGEAKE